MSIRRKTIAEARFPGGAAFQNLVATWTTDASLRLLGFVWEGYDRLRSDVLDHVDAAEADEDLERSVTQLLEPRIRLAMSGDEPFDIQHGTYEEETRQPPPAQPPQYDLAFIFRANPRIIWPLEAKVVRTKTDVARYVREIEDNFISCRYAPFSNGGGMLGYLLVSDTDAVFKSIRQALSCKLDRVSALAGRPHRRSVHLRTVPHGKKYPRRFGCHHLLLLLRPKRP